MSEYGIAILRDSRSSSRPSYVTSYRLMTRIKCFERNHTVLTKLLRFAIQRRSGPRCSTNSRWRRIFWLKYRCQPFRRVDGRGSGLHCSMQEKALSEEVLLAGGLA